MEAEKRKDEDRKKAAEEKKKKEAEDLRKAVEACAKKCFDKKYGPPPVCDTSKCNAYAIEKGYCCKDIEKKIAEYWDLYELRMLNCFLDCALQLGYFP